MHFPLRLPVVILFFQAAILWAEDFPDIRSVPPDIEIPALSEGAPTPGKRVKYGVNVLYLPSDWTPRAKMPVLVELPGNEWKSPHGDVSGGRPEGCHLGYGLTGGRGAILLSVPFLTAKGDDVATKWWGDSPNFDPLPTLKALRESVRSVCLEYGGDESKVVLCGFSRGAIACNFLGLYDEQTARLWSAFVVCSHYDGTRQWVPGSDRGEVVERLSRLGKRPQLIMGEASNVPETKRHLQQLYPEGVPEGVFTFVETGFRNHTDAWILRPCAAREQAREWLAKVAGIR